MRLSAGWIGIFASLTLAVFCASAMLDRSPIDPSPGAAGSAEPVAGPADPSTSVSIVGPTARALRAADGAADRRGDGSAATSAPSDVVPAPRLLVSGRVLDARTSTGVGGAMLDFDERTQREDVVVSAEDGTYSISIPAECTRLSVSHVRYQPQSWAPPRSFAVDRSTLSHDFALEVNSMIAPLRIRARSADGSSRCRSLVRRRNAHAVGHSARSHRGVHRRFGVPRAARGHDGLGQRVRIDRRRVPDATRSFGRSHDPGARAHSRRRECGNGRRSRDRRGRRSLRAGHGGRRAPADLGSRDRTARVLRPRPRILLHPSRWQRCCRGARCRLALPEFVAWLDRPTFASPSAPCSIGNCARGSFRAFVPSARPTRGVSVASNSASTRSSRAA
jgi:hypothetical protein